MLRSVLSILVCQKWDNQERSVKFVPPPDDPDDFDSTLDIILLEIDSSF